MALVPWKNRKESFLSPLRDLDLLHSDLDKLFNTSISGFFDNGSLQSSLPNLDVYDSADSFIIKADIPGLAKEDVEVSVQGNLLTIEGERNQEEEIKDMGVVRSERFHGSFERVISLPTDRVESSKIKAGYKNGVLNLEIPKVEEDKPKKITIDIK